MISIPEQEIIEHLPLKEGMIAVLIGGKNIGRCGVISSIEEQAGMKRRRALVNIKDEKGEIYQSILDYVFVVGDEKPRISLPMMEE